MTRAEAYAELKKNGAAYLMSKDGDDKRYGKTKEALKVLEKENLISRREAICRSMADGAYGYVSTEELMEMPCAQQTGKWIEDANEYCKAMNEEGKEITDYFKDDIACPFCLEMFSTIDNETERFKFCPNCGARMESEG